MNEALGLNETTSINISSGQPDVNTIGIVLGVAGLLIALYQIRKDILKGVKQGLIDEKAAMLFAYAHGVRDFPPAGSEELRLLTRRILTDLQAIGRLGNVLNEEHARGLRVANQELVVRMRERRLLNEAPLIETDFNGMLLKSLRRWYHVKNYYYDI